MTTAPPAGCAAVLQVWCWTWTAWLWRSSCTSWGRGAPRPVSPSITAWGRSCWCHWANGCRKVSREVRGHCRGSAVWLTSLDVCARRPLAATALRGAGSRSRPDQSTAECSDAGRAGGAEEREPPGGGAAAPAGVHGVTRPASVLLCCTSCERVVPIFK